MDRQCLELGLVKNPTPFKSGDTHRRCFFGSILRPGATSWTVGSTLLWVIPGSSACMLLNSHSLQASGGVDEVRILWTKEQRSPLGYPWEQLLQAAGKFLLWGIPGS